MLLAVAVMTLGATVLVTGGARVVADRYSSTNYTIDASVMNGFGGTGSSTNYQMISTGGEAIIGDGTGGSYKLGQGYVAQLDQSLQLTVQPSGLAAYFPLDEENGTAIYDESANGAVGETFNSPAWAGAKVGQGMVFTGNTDAKYAAVPDSVPLSITDKVTVSCWIYVPDIASSDGASLGIVTKDSSPGISNPPYELSLAGRRIYFRTNTSSNGYQEIYSPNPLLSSATWYYVAGTIDTATGESNLYLDGQLVKQETESTTSLADSTGVLHIGRQKSGYSDRYFDGTVDHVKVFSRVLTADEVKAEYDAQNAGREAGLSLGTVIPGASNTVLFDAITQASTSSYNLAIHQNNNLTSGGNTIPAVSGTIASPAAWSEGTTKGLGFTLVSGMGIPGGWGSGGNYAALPGSATSFYTRTGYTPGTKDVLGMRLRLDADVTQPTGNYTNVMTITGTTIP